MFRERERMRSSEDRKLIESAPMACPHRQALLSREVDLRNRAKVARNFAAAVTLGQAALMLQRERISHQDRCVICRRSELEAAA